MFKNKAKNSIRYYLFLVFIFLFLVLSNDFGLLDTQKTAMVMAVGIDRQDETFILTSQIAIPQSSKQGKATETVEIVSRGKTIGEAFEEINAKTGWYPKLVFCNLIVLGEETTKNNVFDALDYFLRDEYLSDNCLVVACDGLAKDILNTSALVDSSSASAIQKVLSSHAERVGSVLPSTLREFSIGYFSDSASAYLPLIATEPQQEIIGGEKTPNSQSGGSEQASPSSSENSGNPEQKSQDKPVFSAGKTALFVHGKRVETLTKEETFALSTVLSKLRLATFSVDAEKGSCSLNIRHNEKKVQLLAKNEQAFDLNVHVTLTAGLLDYSKALPLKDTSDAGKVPIEYFTLAERKLSGDIQTVFEKCKAVRCDLFGVRERLLKFNKRSLKKQEDTALQKTNIQVFIRFQNVR